MNDSSLVSMLGCFNDASVDELFVNGARSSFVRVGRAITQIASHFSDDATFFDFLIDFAASRQIRLDPACGSAGGVIDELPGRWHCVLPPLSRDGPLLSIRRHRFLSIHWHDFIIEPQIFDALKTHIIAGNPLIIAGETGCGKTTFLAAILRQYASNERVIIIESIPEIPKLGHAWVRLAESPGTLSGRGGIDSQRLLVEALRLNPDRLVFGEIRGAEARWFLEASRTGHRGLITTLHAGNSKQAIERMFALSGFKDSVSQFGIAMLKREFFPRVVSFELHG